MTDTTKGYEIQIKLARASGAEALNALAAGLRFLANDVERRAKFVEDDKLTDPGAAANEIGYALTAVRGTTWPATDAAENARLQIVANLNALFAYKLCLQESKAA